jgi:hypothetical protein
MSSEQRENIDNILSYIFIKKLVTPIVRTPAYKLGLVNNAGKVLKKPETPKEKESLTTLDKIIFKMKRLLGSKLINLNSFLYLSTMSNDFYNKLVVRGSVNQRAEVLRIIKDVEKLAENYDASFDDVIQTMVVEQIQDSDYIKD